MEENLDAVRKKKLVEQQKALEAKKAEDEIKKMLRITLDGNAYDRMMNVKMSKPELFMTAAQNVFGAYRTVGRPLTDKELVVILTTIKRRTEHEGSITFERK
jgi:DNA-binding TFAR19-related protein (PDSD5 family)